ncbi:MAG: UMP kinase [Patescibacteria group bacterium]
MSKINLTSPVVMSIGGSLLFDPQGKPNVDFLKKLNSFVRNHVKNGVRFMLVSGGGAICRTYQNAAHEVIKGMSNYDLDWLGVHSTRLNGHLLRAIFVDIAHPRMIENYDHKLENWVEPLVIGAGWKPGWSTDYCAVTLAHDNGAKLMINLSNIDYVFDSDPNKNPEAKALIETNWEYIHSLVGEKWVPGMNTPFDPVATQLAKTIELEVVVANGANFENLEKLFAGEEFVGTIIR